MASSSSSADGALASVSCANGHDCWAVGLIAAAPQDPAPLIEHYDGSRWTVSDPGLEATAALSGVSCMHSGECWAVGHAGAAPGQRVVEHYTGGHWVAGGGSPVAGDGSSLAAVWCTDSRDCWAVGATGGQHTLIERYDGSAWAEVPSDSGGDSDALSGVTCSPAGACWAVGSRVRAGASRPLIEHYTGGGWAAMDSPTPAFSRGGVLRSTTCLSDADCWAVGTATSASGVSQGLVEQFNGTGWTLSRTPAIGGASLAGVTCPEDDDCFVVGTCGAGPASPCRNSVSLIELYDLILPEGH